MRCMTSLPDKLNKNETLKGNKNLVSAFLRVDCLESFIVEGMGLQSADVRLKSHAINNVDGPNPASFYSQFQNLKGSII